MIRFISLLILIGLAPAAQHAQSNTEEGKVWLVAVGIGAYQHPGWMTNLDFPVRGAYDFVRLFENSQLVNTEGPLIDQKASKRGVISLMRKTFVENPEIGPEDMVIFYFSGHGEIAGGMEGICPYDYNPKDVRGLITNEEIQQIMNQSPARHKVCFIEACKTEVQSAEIIDPSYLKSFNQARRKIGGGLVFITSTEAGMQSFGTNATIGGYFTHFLLQGLNGKANTNGDEYVTVEEIFTYVEREVSNYTNGVQVPQINDLGGYNGKLPIIILTRKLKDSELLPLSERGERAGGTDGASGKKNEGKSYSQRVKDLEIRLSSINKSSKSVNVTLKFFAYREGYGTGFAAKAANSDGLADFWKFFPKPIGRLVDNLGNEYAVKTVSGLGYARDANDWTVLKSGEEAIVSIEFSSSSSNLKMGDVFDLYFEIWVAYNGSNGKPARLAHAIAFNDIGEIKIEEQTLLPLPPKPVLGNTNTPTEVKGKWAGGWSNPGGYYYEFILDLDDGGTGTVSGEITWKLRKSPRYNEQSKIGLTAIEYVTGTYDNAARKLSLKGVRTSDPNGIIDVDEYQLTLSGNGNELNGASKTRGTWEGVVQSSRVTEPDKGATKANPSVSISGTYALYKLNDSQKAMQGTMTISAQNSGTLSVKGTGWQGTGKISGIQGYYDWRFTDGKSGRTTFTVNNDGTIQGHVFGSGLDWWYLARKIE